MTRGRTGSLSVVSNRAILAVGRGGAADGIDESAFRAKVTLCALHVELKVPLDAFSAPMRAIGPRVGPRVTFQARQRALLGLTEARTAKEACGRALGLLAGPRSAQVARRGGLVHLIGSGSASGANKRVFLPRECSRRTWVA